MYLLPKTKIGRWSLGLIIAMPVLFFVGGSVASGLYQDVSAGKTIVEDLSSRPALALSMLVGMLCGLAALVTGVVSVFKHQERSVLVFLTILIGVLLLAFLAGEFIFPH